MDSSTVTQELFDIVRRFADHNSATVNKEDVLAVFTSRGESELVVDFMKLRNIKLEKEY